MNGSMQVCTEGSTTRMYVIKSEGIMEVGRLGGSSKGKKTVCIQLKECMVKIWLLVLIQKPDKYASH